MNIWLIVATVLLLGFIPCGIVCTRGTPLNRLAGLQTASVLSVLVLLMLAKGLDRDFLYDLALTQALLSFGAGLVFVRFLERRL